MECLFTDQRVTIQTMIYGNPKSFLIIDYILLFNMKQKLYVLSFSFLM